MQALFLLILYKILFFDYIIIKFCVLRFEFFAFIVYSLRHFHLPHHRLLKKDFLYLTIFLRTFIFVAFFTFLPGIIYKDFLYLGKKEAVAMVSIFFFLYAFINILFMPFLPSFYKKFGVRAGLILGLIITLVMVVFLKARLYLFAGYLYGALSIFWWASYYILFLYLERKGELGRKIGKSEMAVGLAASLSPLITGFLVERSEALFYLFSILILLLTLAAAFKIPHYKINSSFKFKDLFGEIIRYKADFLGFIGAGAEGIIFGVYWPLFLYFFFKNFVSLGAFSTFVALLSALFSYLVGSLTDKMGKEDKIEKVGVLSFSGSWIGKIILQSPIAFAFFDFVHRIINPLFIIPLTKVAFEHAREEGIARYVVFRELGYKVGNLLAIYFMLLISYFNLPYLLIFVLAAVVSFLPMKGVIISNKDGR